MRFWRPGRHDLSSQSLFRGPDVMVEELRLKI